MNNWLKEYFYYTRQERQGTFILALLCVIFFLLPKLYRFWIRPEPLKEEYRKEITAWQEQKQESAAASTSSKLFYFDPNSISEDSLVMLGLSPKTAKTIINYRNKAGGFKSARDLAKIYTLKKEDFDRLLPYINIPESDTQKSYTEQDRAPLVERFAFNPNTADKATLIRLGISAKTSNIIINYRDKGGHFYKPEDLKKIYGLNDQLFLELLPFIDIPTSKKSVKVAAFSKEKTNDKDYPKKADSKPEYRSIDINKAGVSEWQTLRGVGPAYAGRIIRFREALGGFVSIEQIAETYGLPDSTFQKIKPFLKKSSLSQKTPINTIGEEALKKHPYLNWKQARALINYRKHHGPFDDIEDLRKVKALPPEVIDKLAPYLSY